MHVWDTTNFQSTWKHSILIKYPTDTPKIVFETDSTKQNFNNATTTLHMPTKHSVGALQSNSVHLHSCPQYKVDTQYN